MDAFKVIGIAFLALLLTSCEKPGNSNSNVSVGMMQDAAHRLLLSAKSTDSDSVVPDSVGRAGETDLFSFYDSELLWHWAHLPEGVGRTLVHQEPSGDLIVGTFWTVMWKIDPELLQRTGASVTEEIVDGDRIRGVETDHVVIQVVSRAGKPVVSWVEISKTVNSSANRSYVIELLRKSKNKSILSLLKD